MESNTYAVQMNDIVKVFGTFTALDNVKLEVKKGSIHAILGENGAGKSTLMNILYGLYQADSGVIKIHEKEIDIKNPSVAIEQGIGMVHQHFMLVHNFTVVENILLGNEITNAAGFLNYKKSRQKVQELVDKYGLHVDLDAKIENISVGMQQRVEILKALYRNADILILDEPTAVLTPQEIEELISIMHNLTKDGKTIIIITHKLAEIKQSAEECTIIRRGEYVDTVKVEDTTINELATKMVGHAVKLVVDKEKAQPKDVLFEINDLVVEDARKIEVVQGLNLSIRRGEIYGIAGIDGNGQKELVESITNLVKTKSGTIKVNGIEIQNRTPKVTIDSGVSTIHEDRLKRGLVPDFTVAENTILEKYYLRPFSNKGILNSKNIQKYAQDIIDEYDVRPADGANLLARSLSGGNQQKLIIGREVSTNPDVLIAVQPTRGLDVGAIEYVHKSLIRERDKGKAILLISFELDEVMNVSDKIGVIYKGKIQEEFLQGEKNEHEIGLLMAGGKHES
ncbi:ABC transporter ATP-binding protein [Helcococcus sueciensis]|uniref:ABC transporter ATP-binding protein n=1 Tax=Helcococcus sueciensis TaxID=241555 RepID=UPI00040D4B84|nr:ABC transporter ATP-binding protein [Helcococcus sueciensis]